jgi:pyruvate/2-oxoglutarate dehydrogenase complex dihydrolipoamide dehydrogenase (E3) component
VGLWQRIRLENGRFFAHDHAVMSSNRNPYDFDVAIVGGGSGGYAAARTAVDGGLRAVVIEGGKEVGGLCILRGCMPTKTLLYSAEIAHLVRQAEVFGVRTGEVTVDFPQVMARKKALIREFAKYRNQQLTKGRFKFVRAQAKFLDKHTLSLSTGDTVTARHFVISTGSIVAAPTLPQLKDLGYLTSDGALTLTKLPKSLIVLGGGAVAVEAAQMLARFGVKVTVIQRSEHILREFDSDAAIELEKALRREGVTLFANTKLQDAWQEGSLKGVTFQHGGQSIRVAAEEILFALGRVPNIASLELDRAGVLTEHGRILTNTEMQTTTSHIYAAGDCTGTEEIVHIAILQGEIAAHNIAHPNKKRSLDMRLLTVVVFSDPQIARVALTEKVAQARGIPYLAASYPFSDHGKSLIMEALDGFVKLLANPATGEIIGACVTGPLGSELIHEIVAAMHKRMTVHELAAMPHYHPTLAEIWTYPAEELAAKIHLKH